MEEIIKSSLTKYHKGATDAEFKFKGRDFKTGCSGIGGPVMNEGDNKEKDKSKGETEGDLAGRHLLNLEMPHIIVREKSGRASGSGGRGGTGGKRVWD